MKSKYQQAIYVCYIHIKPNGEIFYVGIGNIKRPHSKSRRSKFWHNIVNKYGYNTKIISELSTWQTVCLLEKWMIREIGRRDLGLGPLVNLTDGGDGTINMSTEVKERLAAKLRGKIPWNKNIPMTNDAKIKSSISHTGNKQTSNTRKKISDNHRGHQTEETCKKLSDITKKSWANRKWKQEISIFGQKYKSMREAERNIGINRRELHKLCSDPNNLDYIFN